MSVTCGECDARPTVTFPAARHHRPMAGTKLYCLVTGTCVLTTCPGLHSTVGWLRFETVTYWSQVQRPTTMPVSHTIEMKVCYTKDKCMCVLNCCYCYMCVQVEHVMIVLFIVKYYCWCKYEELRCHIPRPFCIAMMQQKATYHLVSFGLYVVGLTVMFKQSLIILVN